eukprot:scaffold68044_cov58-Phaeocystis_antarctica.AAC.2
MRGLAHEAVVARPIMKKSIPQICARRRGNTWPPRATFSDARFQHEPAPAASHQHTAHSAVAPHLISHPTRSPVFDRRNAAGVRHHDERGSLASDGQAPDQAPKRVGYHGALAPSPIATRAYP